MKYNLLIALLIVLCIVRTSTVSAKTLLPKRYNIATYGAVADGTTLNTKAIQNVIDECARKGGGIVVVPKGIFLSGALFLKPGVNLEIQQDGILRGSQHIEDYPKAMRRIEGHSEPWRAALLNGDKVDHLHITGKGMLDGNGEPFWKLFYSRRSADRTTTNLSVERPQLTFIQNSKDVLIQGITFHNSGFWNLHLYRDQQVTVENCRFEAPAGAVPNNHAPSSDGIDVDSSQDITINGCSFSVGDDDIALKGSKGPFATQDKDSPPVERIHIYNCRFEAGGGIMTCGSEATIVRDVDIRHCITTGPTVLRLKLRPDTPQQYENISLDDITIDGPGVVILSVAPWTQYFDLKGQQPPTSLVRNIKLSNIKGTGGALGMVKGNNGTIFEDITLKNLNVTLKNTGYDVHSFKTATFENVMINGTSVTAPVSVKQ